MSKAFKKGQKQRNVEVASDSDASSEDSKPTEKKAKTSTEAKSDNGEVEFLISDKRRVAITFFKGNHYVDIREFYTSNGKSMPGKKGIALKIDEWNKLKSLIADVDAQIQKVGAK